MQYSVIFAKASELLTRKMGIEKNITTLRGYFQNLQNIQDACRDPQTGEVTKEFYDYVLLPLDEKRFEINANTREITIPIGFRSGVGVTGDQASEIIFFTIDRYFDTTDLATQQIYIEWKNADGDEGISWSYPKQAICSQDEDKLIFGWVLTKEITESAGIVEFAVRFFETIGDEENPELIYSLSTLPTKVSINNTLNYEILSGNIQILGQEVIDMVLGRFKNSEPDGVVPEAEEPTFTINIIDMNDLDLEDLEENPLKVQAFVTEGVLTYQWKRAEPDSDVFTIISDENINPKGEYVPTDDTIAQDYNKYFQYIAGDTGTGEGKFEPIFIEPGAEILPEANIYEIASIYTPKKVGKYQAFAINTHSGTDPITGELIYRTAASASNIAVVPNPKAPFIEPGDTAIVTEDLTNLELFAPKVTPDGKGTISYEWLKNNGSDFASVKTGDYTTNSDLYYLPDGYGIYRLKLYTLRNNVTIDNMRINSTNQTVEYIDYRITGLPSLPVILTPGSDFDGITSFRTSPGETIAVTIKEAEVANKDSFVYQWYMIPSMPGEASPDMSRTTAIEGATESTFTVPIGNSRYYYCEVRTKYNEALSDPVKTTKWFVM